MARAGAALLQIALVVLLGAIEGASRFNLGRYRTTQSPTSLEGGLGLFRRGLLLRRVEEYRRAILRADVRALAVYLGWIVQFPEGVQQLLVTHLRGVEG